jgi:enediyne biosynthesis protein E4
MLIEQPPTKTRRFGRRHKRIAWTLFSVAAAGLCIGLVFWKINRDSQPEQYQPGEQSADITTEIATRGATAAPRNPVTTESPRIEPKPRRSDPLRDPGSPLPAGAPLPRFTDVTREAGLAAFRTFNGPRSSQLPEDIGSGVAWGDFDNDGFDDLFLVGAGASLNAPASQRAASALFRNKGDGTFEKVADFPELHIIGMGAAWADYDNDGWLDLIVTGYDTLLLFHNEHGHLVRNRSFPSPKGLWASAAWGDYDRDGHIDLYICGYVRYEVDSEKQKTSTQQFGLEVPYTLNPASFEAERNLLFHNNGDGTFTEVAKRLGVENSDGRSLGAVWHDFDGDGWLDLYVANDVSENKLYLNRHGSFVDSGHSAWIAEYRGSMGLAVGDFDRDGDDDLFISHWVAQQFALYQCLTMEKREAKQPFELHYTDVAEISGVGQVSLQKIGWGAAWFDFDSDGWLDLAVANGSTFETKEGARRLVPMSSFLFWNDGKKFFHELSGWNRSFSSEHASRGLAVADYDNDGALDVLVVDHGEGVRLLRNDVPHGNWVEFRLHDRHRGPGDGALVIARAGNQSMRWTVGSGSYLSQNTRRVHFGLGKAETVDRLEIRWPGGKTQTWSDVHANTIWDLREGDAGIAEMHAAGKQVQPREARKLTREETVQFWSHERAGMDAMKRQGEVDRAAAEFRAALAIDPSHEDSLYYLANCLTAKGDAQGALAQLRRLAEVNPMSHRAWQRTGALLAAMQNLQGAEDALGRAARINPEETGTLLLLGEVALARHDLSLADQRLELALRTNARAVGALYLRAYIAYRQRNLPESTRLLERARAARGADWKPKGSVAEGDVRRRMFQDSGFLTQYWEAWDGTPRPDRSFTALQKALQ